MNASDYAFLIAACALVTLALVGLAAHFIRSDYQLSGSFRVARRNPPRPPRDKAAEATVTEISKGSAA